MADPAVWTMIHEQRAATGDALEGLTPAQWDEASLCEAWRVRDVVAHLIVTARMTPGAFFGGFLTSGFRFHAFSAKNVAGYADKRPAQLLAEYRNSAKLSTGPPGPALIPLGEIVTHSEDIRRPLGLPHTYPDEVLVTVADFYKHTQPLIGGKKRVAGLHLRATDLSWETGSGPEVSGPAASLILAMAGREAACSDLTGEGISTLRARM